MQERKFNSAFRVSSKQFDSLKMQNSLDQLLGAHCKTRTGSYHQDSDMDIINPPSTSTLVRCSTGPHSSSKDKNTGFKSSSDNGTISDFSQKLAGPQVGLFAKLRSVLDELAQQKKAQPQAESRVARIFADQKMDVTHQNPTIRFDQDANFLQSIIAGLTQHPMNYLPPFALETLRDDSNKIYTKLQQLRSLDQKIAQGCHQKADSCKMDIQKRKESYQEISSLNSLDEEIEMNTKPTTQLNHLSISSANQLEDLSLKTVHSETSTPTKIPENRSCIAPSSPDFSNTTLQQRLEIHHVKNRKCKSNTDEMLEGRGTSKPSLGTYPLDERIRKILRYKKKIIKWRVAHPPNRNFSGRSAVAGSKPRIKGKFVKPEEYQKYLESQKKIAAN